MTNKPISFGLFGVCTTNELRKRIFEISRDGREDKDPPEQTFEEIIHEMKDFGDKCDENLGRIGSEIHAVYIRSKQ